MNHLALPRVLRHVLIGSLVATGTTIALGVAEPLPARSAAPPPPTASVFEPAAQPCRVADTRNGTGFQAVASDTLRVRLTGRCGVPADATAAVVTVTVTQSESSGFLTVWPSGAPLPNASIVNYTAHQDRANGAIVTLGADGSVDIRGTAPAGVIVDVSGWFRPAAEATAGRFVGIEPRRAFDTRAAGFERQLAPGESVTVPLPAGVPADAVALAVNLTTTDPNQPGFFTLHPAGTALPEASALNTDGADQSRASGSITPVSPDGVTIYSHSGGHVILDVTGWFTGPSATPGTDGLFVPAPSPQRLVDTRSGDPVWAGGEIDVAVPAVDAAAAAVNVTLVGAHEWGFLTAHAAHTARPGTSTVNATARGETAANFAISPVSASGIGLAASAGADVVVDLAGWFLGLPSPMSAGAPENVRPPACATDTSPAGLTDFFANRGPFVGGDYQRAFALPDGRTLWMFQDVAMRTRTGATFLHNAGLVQDGNCFHVLQSGSYSAPGAYLFPWAIEPFSRWFWPLGGDVGVDGNFHLFVAEMRERSSKYLGRTEPVATWKVTISLADLTVIDFRPAADSSPALYGWSVTSDGSYTYLYAHCYRQFGYDIFPFSDPPVYVHDFGCVDDVTVARIPRGQFDAVPSYWNGSSWGASRSAAVPVIPRGDRRINPTQVRFDGSRFLAVTKEGDWWGDTIYLDVAPAANGPWTNYARIPIPPRCGGCNTYFASWVPETAGAGALAIGVSNNTFEGSFRGLYGPTFLHVWGP